VPAATGIKRIGIAVASALAAGVGFLMILSLLIPSHRVRDAVKAQIRTVTGLEPVLRGDVAVSLFPTGIVRFSDVNLGDDQTGAPALSAQELRVRLRFFPFLLGRIEIADVTLVRPTIMVAFAPDGRSNWASHFETLARALTPSPEQVRSFSEIHISDGTITLRDDAHQRSETLTSVDFALAWPSISRTFAATGSFSWHRQPFEATLSLSDFLAALTGDRSGLKVRLRGEPLKFAFDGNISHRPNLKIEGVLAADSGSLRDTLHWAAGRAIVGNGFERFALKAHMDVVGRNVALSKVNLELDGNAGEGVLTYVVGETRQNLQGTLAVEDLNLTPYISSMHLLTGERSWSKAPMGLDRLNGLDIDVRISAARVTLDHVSLGRTAIAANLRGGNLTLAIGESQAFGGTLKGSVVLARSTAGTDLQAQLQFHDVMLDQTLGAFLGVRRVEGKGDIGITVSSTGRSIYELTEALNGSVTLTSRKGAIAGLNVEQSLKRLERNPLAVRGSDFRGGRTPYDVLAVNLRVTEGTAHAQDVRIEAPTMRVGMVGTSSIPARNLDLKGTAILLASAGSEAPPEFQLPFVVMGSWDDPLFWPDIQLLIRRSGAAAPLLDAVRGRSKHGQAPALAGEAAPLPATAPASQAAAPR
jgi:AsmA protein